MANDRLVDLALTFDGTRPDPSRFEADPNDSSRPHPNKHPPTRPMPPAQVVELVRTGNLNYASFIQDCRKAGGASPVQIAGLPTHSEHRLFLNQDEVGIGGVMSQEPYAAVLSCIDARVPVELITGQAANDTFVIRTAGNTLTGEGEGSGSLRYILSSYGAGTTGAHPTVSAVFVFGHTKCGAVKAAYDAFKPSGTGVKGMHPSLAKILLEIKHAVDFVLGGAGNRLGDEEEVKDAISHVNAVFASVRARQIADEIGVGGNVEIHYASYHVTDFYLRKTSFPKQGGQRLTEVIAAKGFAKCLARAAEGGMQDADARRALLDDGIEFAKMQQGR